MIQGIPGFIDEMDHLENMKKTKIKLTPETVTKVRDFSTILAVLIAMIILTYYKYELVPRDDGAYDYKPYIPPQQRQWIEYLGYIQAVSAFTILLGFCFNNRNLVIKDGWRRQVEKNQNEMKADKKRIEKMRE